KKIRRGLRSRLEGSPSVGIPTETQRAGEWLRYPTREIAQPATTVTISTRPYSPTPRQLMNRARCTEPEREPRPNMADVSAPSSPSWRSTETGAPARAPHESWGAGSVSRCPTASSPGVLPARVDPFRYQDLRIALRARAVDDRPA